MIVRFVKSSNNDMASGQESKAGVSEGERERRGEGGGFGMTPFLSLSFSVCMRERERERKTVVWKDSLTHSLMF